MKPSSLATLLHAFFHEWMARQRNLSHHTVCSYRDTWKLLLQFVASRRRRDIAQLSLADLQASEVTADLPLFIASLPLSLIASRWRSRNALRLQISRSRSDPSPRCATWMLMKSRQCFESPTDQAWRD